MKRESSQNKLVLVTGATGFLGSSLIPKLLENGYKVRALCRDVVAASKILPIHTNLQIVSGDILQVESLRTSVQDVELVYHLASEMDFFPKDKSKVYQVNVEGTRNLVNLCKGVKRFIYSSSVTTIGHTIDEIADENHECRPEYDYGASKLAAEKVVMESGLPYIILRLSGIFGPRDTFVIYELIQMVNQGILFFIPGSGSRKLSFSYVDDIVDALMLAANNGKLQSTYIICSGNLTVKEWIVTIAKNCGRLPPFIHLPMALCRPVIQIISPIMNLGKKRTFMYHTETLDRMLEDHIYSSSKAESELQWKPKHTMQEAITKTIQFYFEKGYLIKIYFSPVFLILCGIILVIWFWRSQI